MEFVFIGATTILFLILSSKACMISHPKHLGNIDGIWNDGDTPRSYNKDCECGKYAENGTKPWNLFIHVTSSPGLDPKICSGTIIASNLVASSHACFLLPKRHFNIYDIWRPIGAKRNAVWDVEKITVSSSKIMGQGEIFPVKEIIYNLDYAVKAAAKTYPPEYDVVLLRVSADFTGGNSRYRPICLPELNEVKDMVLPKIQAYYYGTMDNPLFGTPDIYEGILKAEGDEECEKMLSGKFSLDKHLCFRFHGGTTSPVQEGGPLYIDSSDSTVAFLIGIATVVKTYLSPIGADYNLFTNLMPLIKYIEWQANKSKSRWCKVPASFKARHVEDVVGPTGQKRDPWPWEELPTPLQRNEVLDCICGLVNPPLGRIAGGEEAEPYEFGWMALLLVYFEKKGLGGFLCGGTIINDRMILTASHCLINKEKIHAKDIKSALVKAQNLDVRVEVHKRYLDGHLVKVKTVLYHPDFVTGKREGYFDYDIGTSHGIRPICLPKMGAPYKDLVGLQTTVAGWGKLNPDVPFSNSRTLQKVEVPVAPRQMCASVAISLVTERNICAGTLNRFKDAAGGDSGGPLMIFHNDTNRYTEYGIVSWGEDRTIKGVKKTAALYSDVQKLISFVEFHATRAGAKWCKVSSP